MELIVIVLNKVEVIDDLLLKFMDLDIKGATVIDSRGMGHIVADFFSMFAMFRGLDMGKDYNSKTIFTVSDSPRDKENMLIALNEVVGDINAPDTAILFTVPISDVQGVNFHPQPSDLLGDADKES